jgi:hypothetical protein
MISDLDNSSGGNNRRNGKVARLDAKLRELVNQMMLDGTTYPKIIATLAERGVPDISEDNLSRWFQGGHKDWLRQNERLAEMAGRREFALKMAEQNRGGSVHEAAMQLAASQLFEALSDFDLSQLKGLLAEDPENYAKVVNSLAKLGEGALKYEKYREAVQERKAAMQKEIDLAKKDKGVTRETIDRIERELKLL